VWLGEDKLGVVRLGQVRLGWLGGSRIFSRAPVKKVLSFNHLPYMCFLSQL